MSESQLGPLASTKRPFDNRTGARQFANLPDGHLYLIEIIDIYQLNQRRGLLYYARRAVRPST
jgi:hypothetical protein